MDNGYDESHYIFKRCAFCLSKYCTSITIRGFTKVMQDEETLQQPSKRFLQDVRRRAAKDMSYPQNIEGWKRHNSGSLFEKNSVVLTNNLSNYINIILAESLRTMVRNHVTITLQFCLRVYRSLSHKLR